MNVRKLVFNSLLNVEKDGGFSNLTLDNALKSQEIEAQDKRFATNLFYGVIERKLSLDYILAIYSSKKLNKLSPLVLTALRMGLYQIIYMDKVPCNAAVDESVKLIKSSKEKYAAGFVNAILRSYLRDPKELPTDDSLKSLEARYSCPKWFIEELILYIGKEKTILMLEDSLKPSTTYIRSNNYLISDSELSKLLLKEEIIVNSTDIEGCFILNDFGSVERLDTFKKGYFHIQDKASQIAVSCLKPKPCERVLDICSAPGGKAFTSAELMNNKGEIIACDLHEHRVKLIKKGAERLKLDIIKTIKNDASKFNENLGHFDKIICDVPCSGFGDIGRKPEIKYKNPDDLTNLYELQYNILCISASYLKQGGTLMYSTCTLRYDENEAIVKRFLNSHKEFKLKEVEAPFCEDGFNRLIPGVMECDGFFFALIERG